MKTTGFAVLLSVAVASTTGVAQTSASYRLEEHVFNSGGAPSHGMAASSASYSLSLVAIGEGITSGVSPSSALYEIASGFPTAYPAPGEVDGLSFVDAQTLVWSHERSAGGYNLYRDLLSTITGPGYGSCQQQAIADNTTTDPSAPPTGDGFLYLVTVENRLAEEGTRGFSSAGVEREGEACP